MKVANADDRTFILTSPDLHDSVLMQGSSLKAAILSLSLEKDGEDLLKNIKSKPQRYMVFEIHVQFDFDVIGDAAEYALENC